jgi:regulator of sigma E protease
MSDFFGSIWWLLVALGILVTFHEFGHYWVARRFGVKVLRFSVGFGKPLWLRRGKDGTEWVVAAIPLGGYVKMLGERDGGDPVAADEVGQSFFHKPVLQRMAIVAAGPIANLLLCIFFLWAMFVIGRPDYSPVVGEVGGIAAEAGLRRGDVLTAVDERKTPTWAEAQIALATAGLDRGQTQVEVRSPDGASRTVSLDMSGIPTGLGIADVVRKIGVVPQHAIRPAIVGEIMRDSPARDVLQTGSWGDIAPGVARLGARGGGPVTIERKGEPLTVTIAPAMLPDSDAADAPRNWKLGVAPAPFEPAPKNAVLRYGPVAAVPAALRETGHQTRELFAMFKRAFSGLIKVTETVSGPIGIARAANHFAKDGLASYLQLLALLSLSLAILNLLPIPVLDGGHLMYYFIELVKGSPLSERSMAAGQYVGLALLLGLMGLAFYNDLYGLLQ